MRAEEIVRNSVLASILNSAASIFRCFWYIDREKPRLVSILCIPMNPAEGIMRLVERYQLLDKLGAGGMGVVYRARDERLDRTVAVKSLPPSRLPDDGAVRRFQREARVLARLSHPNIVAVHDVGEDRGRQFLVMEYVEGVTLAALIKDKGRLPVAEAAEYARQAALGLAHAHAQGMVHRDIKPANLMVTRAGDVKILDLGLAGFLQDQIAPGELTRENAALGTPDYMAPEQFRDAHATDARADIYALGCTLFQMLTGQVPFPGSSFREKADAHQHQPPPDLRTVDPSLSEALAQVVARMMAKDPVARFQTAHEVWQALAPFSAAEVSQVPAVTADWQSPTAIPPATPQEQPRASSAVARQASGRGWVFAAIGLGVLLPLVLIAFLAMVIVLIYVVGTTRDDGDPPVAKVTPAKGPANAAKSQPKEKMEQGNLAPEKVQGPAPPKEKKNDRVKKDGAPVAPDPVLQGQKLLEAHSGPVRCLAFTPSGEWLASGSDDQSVRLWRVTTGKGRRLGTHHLQSVTALAFSHDGQLLASAGKQNLETTIKFWKVREQTEVTPALNWQWNVSWGQHLIYSLAFSADAKRLAVGSYGPVLLWDLKGRTRSDLDWVQATPCYAYAVAFSPDSKIVAAGCHAPEGDFVRLWAVARPGESLQVLTGRKEFGVLGHNQIHAALAFSTDGKKLARITRVGTTNTSGAELTIWRRTEDGDFIRPETHSVPLGSIYALSFTTSADLIIACAGETALSNGGKAELRPEGEIRVWTLADKKVRNFQTDSTVITALALSPQAHMVAAGNANGAIFLQGLHQEEKK
jgi:WD40 repeat protein